jgi:hypothetical protein
MIESAIQTGKTPIMNASTRARIACVLVLIAFSVLGLGPIPITSMIGLFVVIFLPAWFKKLVDNIYADKK